MTDIDEMAAEIVRLRRDRECMTLRDYFAGQAIAGLMSGLGSSMEWPSHQQIKSAAGYSYQVADALLKARTQGE
jgi:hypothetical protein